MGKPFTPKGEKQVRAAIRRSLQARDAGNEQASAAEMRRAQELANDPALRETR